MDSDKYIGRLLDNRYEIQEVIGVGGMAVVYKARCHRLNRLVAIKILKDDYSTDDDFRRRFHAESQAVAMLSHPNIVSVYDVSTSSEADYIVMELIDGISLKQYMEKRGVLNWKETLHFAMQIGKALEHAHSRGIVHRDIKPHNVMVLKNGSVKVADFGIARMMSKGNTLTKEALGSVHYISPEQAKGGRVDNRSDIYSLGVVMYEMMTGRPPYDGESPVSVAIQHINGGAAMPSTLNPNIPGGLEQIIMKAMAHEPGDRYTSATAMLYDMDEFRKDPAMLFDYNIPPTDEVTRLQSKVAETAVAAGSSSHTVAVGKTAGQSLQSAGTAKPAVKQQSKDAEARRAAAAQARRRREEQEEKQGKIATIAIVAGSIAVVIAIAIFLFLFFGSGNQPEYVYVPTYVGKNYETLPESENFRITLGNRIYSSEFEKGYVIDQQPPAGDKVVKNTEVVLVVSLGPEPQQMVMLDLVELDQTQAKNYLVGQDLKVVVRTEYSDTVEEGLVTRTSPAKDEPLEKGQLVTMWVSKGPEVKRGLMPNVAEQTLDKAKQLLEQQDLDLTVIEEEESSETVTEGRVVRTEPAAGDSLQTGQQVTLYISTGPKLVKMPGVEGMNIDTALRMLKYAGFTNIDYDNYVENDAPQNAVVTQSVREDEEVPLSTKIVLTLSLGPTEPPTTAPTTVPTEPPTTAPTEPAVRSKTVTWQLMEEMVEDYTLTYTCDGVSTSVTIPAGQDELTLTLSGSGVKTYTLYINGSEEVFNTETVNFDE